MHYQLDQRIRIHHSHFKIFQIKEVQHQQRVRYEIWVHSLPDDKETPTYSILWKVVAGVPVVKENLIILP